jgi:long-chain acyl-CoA synthetase
VNIAQTLQIAARAYPERPAISLGDETRLNYRDFGGRTARLAGALRGALGLQAGERVALVMMNGPEYLEILFAVWHAGLIAVPMNARLHAREHVFMIGDCGAKLVFVSTELAHDLAREVAASDLGPRFLVPGEADYRRLLANEPGALADVAADTPAWLFYTSGTTGRPKGAILSHRNLLFMALAYHADVDYLDERDCLLHLAAQSHASGLFALSFIPRGANQVLLASGGFDPSELAALIAHYERVTFFVPPTGLRRITAAPALGKAPLDHVRTILCGAAPVYAGDLKAALARFGPCVWNGYGQGESPCTITAMSKAMVWDARDDETKLNSVGIARTGVTVSVCDEAGRALPLGEIGEIVVRGDVVMQGYWRNETASQAALAPWGLRTGDLGCFDEAGYLTLKDRAKDLIISGGSNIYPREIEEVLLAHPGVAEVAVVGVADAEWGERPLAFVVRREGVRPLVDAAALEQLMLANLARFKRPKAYRFVMELPKNAYGKVLKRELKATAETAGKAVD